jgi:hypothetical protein
MEPQKVPEKLTNPVDYRLLILIFGLAIGFQIYFFAMNEPGPELGIISALLPLAGAVMGFVVAKRYRNSEVFGKAYLALGLGMLMNFLGEVVYYIGDYYGQDDILFLADIIFYLFYPLAFYHLIKNIRFFKPKVNVSTKILIPAIPIFTIIVYSVLSLVGTGEANSDFFYSLLYVIGGSVVLSAAILGASIFRQGVLGTAWLVLVIGLLLTGLADTLYSYLDLFGQYYDTHPMNILYYSGYMIITYALYKHRDII